MAVQPQTPYKEYTANGSTNSFALEFDCDNQDHLIVLVDDIEPVVGAWSLIGGAVVFGTAPTNGKKITIQRNTPFRRDGDFQSYDNSFRPPGVNNGFDKIWLKLQELGVVDWILSNRINDLRAYVDKQDNVLQENIDSLKNYVDDKDDELRNYLLNAIQEQGVALDQLEEYYSYLMQQLAQVAIDRGWAASFIVSADGSTQQEINDFGGAKWRNKPLGYDIGSTVKLENGDIVKSTVANNIIDPNIDMTGWRNIDADIRSSVRYKLSSYGAKADDRSAAVKNREALIQASRDGVVVVDGNYHIDVTGSTNDFLTSIDWVADVAGGSLNFVGTISSFIRVGSIDHVIVDGVKLTSDNQVGVLMTILNDTVVVNKLQFTCEIATGIGVFRGTWTNTIDPKVQYYGIKEANFNGAKLRNTNSSFVLMNCPCDFFDLRGVRINNMAFVPFSFGIDNAHQFEQSIKDLQPLYDSDGLVCINSPDFWANGSGGSYLSVSIFEGGHAKRSNTHVEGLKTRSNIAVYDFYLNCKSLEADNVFWKNNICFNSNKLNNELMKCKGTPDSKFTNSKFIVEKEFIISNATDVQSQGWVTLFAKTYGNDKSKHVMNDNTVDVYMLLGMSSSTQTKNIEIVDNAIHAEIFASNFLNISNTKSTDITTHADAEVILKGNKIKFDKIDTIIRAGDVYKSSTLIKMNHSAAADTYHKIHTENEVLIGEVSSGLFQMYDGLAAGELVLKDSIHIQSCPVEDNNRLFWGGGLISTARPATMRHNAVSVPPVYVGALFTALNLMRGGEQEFNLSIPYKGLSTYIAGPVLAKKTIIVELSASQMGVTYSAAYKLILETDGYTYQSAEGVYTKYPYPTANTTATPIVSKISAFDEIMAGVTFIVGASVGQLIRIRYEFSQAILSSLIDYKIKIRIV